MPHSPEPRLSIFDSRQSEGAVATREQLSALVKAVVRKAVIIFEFRLFCNIREPAQGPLSESRLMGRASAERRK
jgi:hypothetical protein